MKIQEYNAILGNQLTREKQEGILFEVLMFLNEAKGILFKDGEWNPLKWHSIKRWIRLAKLAYVFIRMVLKVMK